MVLINRNVREGWQGEFGAMRIPDEHFFTLELVRQFNLTLDPFINYEAENFYHVYGTTFNDDDFKDKMGAYQKDFELAPHEYGKTPKELHHQVME